MRTTPKLNEGDTITRRATVQALAAGAALAAFGSRAASLPAPGSLPSALAAALQRHEPLVLLASADGCGFCDIVRDNYLGPLQRDSRLPVAQLDLGSRAGLVDFNGNASTADDVLRRWHVNVAPTVLFFGPGGHEVAPRLVGLSEDFYSGYLDQRLETARRAVRAAAGVKSKSA